MKSSFQDRIKEAMEKKQITQSELAKRTGITQSSISDWIRGKYLPKQDKVDVLAKALNVTPSYLMGWSSIEKPLNPDEINGIMPLKKLRRIPILGQIACGNPILADENYIGYFTADDKYLDSDFCLYAKGDSMIDAGIDDGDLVFIKKQSDVDDGEIAAVLIGDDATLKRVYKVLDRVQLRAENPKYKPINLDGTQPVMILGKATHVLSHIK